MRDRLLIGFFVSNLDVTIVSSSLTSITDSLDGFEKRSWIVTGYLATYTGTTHWNSELPLPSPRVPVTQFKSHPFGMCCDRWC